MLLMSGKEVSRELGMVQRDCLRVVRSMGIDVLKAGKSWAIPADHWRRMVSHAVPSCTRESTVGRRHRYRTMAKARAASMLASGLVDATTEKRRPYVASPIPARRNLGNPHTVLP